MKYLVICLLLTASVTVIAAPTEQEEKRARKEIVELVEDIGEEVSRAPNNIPNAVITQKVEEIVLADELRFSLVKVRTTVRDAKTKEMVEEIIVVMVLQRDENWKWAVVKFFIRPSPEFLKMKLKDRREKENGQEL